MIICRCAIIERWKRKESHEHDFPSSMKARTTSFDECTTLTGAEEQLFQLFIMYSMGINTITPQTKDLSHNYSKTLSYLLAKRKRFIETSESLFCDHMYLSVVLETRECAAMSLACLLIERR